MLNGLCLGFSAIESGTRVLFERNFYGAEPRPLDRPAAPGREQPVAQSVIAEAAYYR
jgi:hypothetical protein